MGQNRLKLLRRETSSRVATLINSDRIVSSRHAKRRERGRKCFRRSWAVAASVTVRGQTSFSNRCLHALRGDDHPLAVALNTTQSCSSCLTDSKALGLLADGVCVCAKASPIHAETSKIPATSFFMMFSPLLEFTLALLKSQRQFFSRRTSKL